jgi:predicted small lipoprotein YifL
MVRARVSLVLVLCALAGCGGRDPLYGGLDDAPPPGPPATVTADGGSTRARDAATQTPTPGPTRDASVVIPPTPVDAAPPTMTPPDSCPPPSCLAKLQASCIGAGRCVQQRAMGRNAGANVCWSNGVKAQSVGGMGQFAVVVSNPDGTLCYIVEMSNNGGVRALTYSTPDRKVVARATLESGCFSTVTCTGEMNPQATKTACLPALAAVGTSTNCASACSTGTCM